MFGNLFNRNSGDKKANSFENTKKLVTSNPDLSERLKNILEPKKEEIKKIFVPNYLTQEEIDNLPNITDWEDLVDMKDRTKWTNSPYKAEIIEQRMFEVLPDQLFTIWNTVDDVEILLDMNHDLSYKSEFNRSIKNKLLTFFPDLLLQIDDINLLSSWYDRVDFLDFWNRNNNELEDMVKNRLKDIIWSMSWSERLKAKENLTHLPNIVDDLIDERNLELILESKEWDKIYNWWDNETLSNTSSRKDTEEGIYKLIQNREIVFLSKDLSNVFDKLEKRSTIISTEITDALRSYFSDINQ